MLIYNPAFDLYHGIFRMLQLINRMSVDKTIEIEKIRLLDFFLLFPNELKNVSLPKEALKFKKYIPKEENPYSRVPNPTQVFHRMEPFQLAALKSLASYGFIDEKNLNDKKIVKNQKTIPEELLEKLNNLSTEQQNVLALLSGPLGSLDLLGTKGLKSRTHLMEYRYDPK